jgi:hypothetical protein
MHVKNAYFLTHACCRLSVCLSVCLCKQLLPVNIRVDAINARGAGFDISLDGALVCRLRSARSVCGFVQQFFC